MTKKNAIAAARNLDVKLYLVDSSCKWRQLPHNFPKWQTVYSFFRRAIEKALWDKILEHLVKLTLKKAGRNPHPFYGSDQTFDGGKKAENDI